MMCNNIIPPLLSNEVNNDINVSEFKKNLNHYNKIGLDNICDNNIITSISYAGEVYSFNSNGYLGIRDFNNDMEDYRFKYKVEYVNNEREKMIWCFNN